tara:strand:- start:23 stop:220 length:198 start_codon:yes stop_codon:yes gene_type:complete
MPLLDLVVVVKDTKTQMVVFQDLEMLWMQSKTLEVVEEHSMVLLVILQEQVLVVLVSSLSHILPN